MALPTIVKTWQYAVNQVLRATGTPLADHQRWVRLLKTSLVGFASSPWVVRYSCDGVTAGAPGDGVDRWTSDGALLFSGSAHSWIVLHQAGVAANFEVCVDLNGGAPGFGTILFSANAGFTGGTTTARPTAADQVTLSASGQLSAFSNSANIDAVLHVMQSTDGQCTRAFLSGGTTNTCALFVLFDRPREPVTGWTFPAVTAWLSAAAGNGDPSYATLNDAARFVGYQAGAMPLFATAEMQGGAAIGEGVGGYNDFTGEWVLTPIGLASETAGARGRHGTLFDLWWAPTAQPVGDSYPHDGTRQIARLGGHLAVPWNGSQPRTHL